MKKLLIVIGGFLVLLLAAIILIPIIFKNDIRQALDDAMKENVNAKIYYNEDGFSLSLIKSFPDLTVSIREFGVVGIEEFQSDTLTSIGNFQVTVDIMSALFGDQIMVEEILLESPAINVIVLENGKANYDIAKSSDIDSLSAENPEDPMTDSENSSSGSVNVGIKRWAISNAKVSYKDASLKFYTTLTGLNHEGSGDFTLDVMDLVTQTSIEAFSLGYEDVEYISNKSVSADVTLNMDLANSTYTFKENRISLNDFAIAADGYISMPGEDISMDISFGGNNINLKSILSLIPGVYQEYLSGVSANGEINFDGFVKGTYNETSMPAIAANLSVAEGKIKYADFNIPMEKINIQTSFNYPSADLSQTSFNVDKFSMLIDGEPLSAYLKFKNLNNFQWDFGVDGNADLEKITRIVPLEGMTLTGKINAKLNTAGKMSDLEAEKYDLLPTKGSLSVRDFLFKSTDLPQGFSISEADLTMNPKEINLAKFTAQSGKSDFNMNGKVTNFLAYALNENEILKGQLNFSSSQIDITELMPASEEEEAEEEESADSVTTKVPENIDFLLASNIDKIVYDNISLNDFKGSIRIKDGAVLLEENSFKMLDGTFELTGSYRTKDLEKPAYDLKFKIKNLSIASAFSSFETIQQYVPIAKQVSGKFSTTFDVNGLLGADLMPITEEINLAGLVNIAEASLDKGDFMQKLSAVTSLQSGSASGSDKITVKDVLIATSIENGRMYVEPFNLKVKGQEATVGGNNGLDGSLDYAMLLKDVPTGAVGNAINSALSSFTGGNKLVADKINLNLGIGGTTDDPKIKLLGTSDGSSSGGAASVAKQAVKDQVSAQINEQKEKAQAELDKQKEEQRQKILAEAEKKAQQIRVSGKDAAEKARKEGYAAADKLIADAGSNPIKKKIAEEAAKKLRTETDKKANSIESEANKKADQLLAEAKEKAANI